MLHQVSTQLGLLSWVPPFTPPSKLMSTEACGGPRMAVVVGEGRRGAAGGGPLGGGSVGPGRQSDSAHTRPADGSMSQKERD